MAKDLIIFDTCVFIKAFRKDREASLMLQNMQLQIAVTVVTVLELYFGAKTSIRKTLSRNFLTRVISYHSTPPSLERRLI
jgi:predicted nucleic acid-binding protein